MSRPSPGSRSPCLFLCLVAWAISLPVVAEAQNDWQFPDPYFGILEFEKSAPDRRGPSRRWGWDAAATAGRPAERAALDPGVPGGRGAATGSKAGAAADLPPGGRKPWRRRGWR
jgi:hypothetical protein